MKKPPEVEGVMVWVEKSDKERFFQYCKEHQFTASEIIRAFIHTYPCGTYTRNRVEEWVDRNRSRDVRRKRYTRAKRNTELLTVTVKRELWEQAKVFAKEQGTTPTRVVSESVSKWLKKPHTLRHWKSKERIVIKLRLDKNEVAAFRDVCFNQIHVSMSGIVDGLLRNWLITQRRKQNHWNVDPYK